MKILMINLAIFSSSIISFAEPSPVTSPVPTAVVTVNSRSTPSKRANFGNKICFVDCRVTDNYQRTVTYSARLDLFKNDCTNEVGAQCVVQVEDLEFYGSIVSTSYQLILGASPSN